MKKITILLAVLLISACAFAQKATEIQVSKLPKATTDYISDNLPGAKITKASKVEDKGVLTYSVDIDVKGHKHVLIFDKDGKFLKKGDALIDSTTPKSTPASKPAQKTTTDPKQEEPKK
jgi:hypothetical protein